MLSARTRAVRLMFICPMQPATAPCSTAQLTATHKPPPQTTHTHTHTHLYAALIGHLALRSAIHSSQGRLAPATQRLPPGKYEGLHVGAVVGAADQQQPLARRQQLHWVGDEKWMG